MPIFKQGATYWKDGRQIFKEKFYRIVDVVTGEPIRHYGDAVHRSLAKALEKLQSVSTREIVEEFEAWCDADIDDRLRPDDRTLQAEMIETAPVVREE